MEIHIITGIISNIQRFSVNDGPGIRTTVFLKGCPLHCRWCHNPETISPAPEIALHDGRCIRCGECVDHCTQHAIRPENGSFITLREECRRCGDCVDACVAEARVLIGRKINADDLMSEIRKDAVFFANSGGGVTFSGGEPLMQHEFLCTLLHRCSQEGVPTAVDTAGYAPAHILGNVAEHADLFLFDLKTMDDEVHRRYTGVSNRRILENLCLLDRWKTSVIVRVPVIPDVNDDEKSIRAIGSFVGNLASIHEIHLLPYHQTAIDKYRRLGIPYTMVVPDPLPPGICSALADVLQQFVETVVIGG
jgi:pyruvate formate lyase activating enzyme